MLKNTAVADVESAIAKFDESKRQFDSFDELIAALPKTGTDEIKDNASLPLEEQRLVLLNMLYAPKQSRLHCLATVMSRLENLSHTLAWTREECVDSFCDDLTAIHLVEVPRLKLSFHVQVSSKGNARCGSSTNGVQVSPSSLVWIIQTYLCLTFAIHTQSASSRVFPTLSL